MKLQICLVLGVLFSLNVHAQQFELNEVDAQLDQFTNEFNYKVVDHNFGKGINLDSISALLSKEYVFENRNYHIDRSNIDVYSQNELINYIKQEEDKSNQFKAYLIYVLVSDSKPEKKQEIFNEINDELDPFIIKLVESINGLKPVSNNEIIEYDWFKGRSKINSYLLFHLYVSAHIDKASTIKLLQSINSTKLYSEYIKWIKNHQHNEIYSFEPMLFDILAEIGVKTENVEDLSNYIYLLDRFEAKYHQQFVLNGLNIIHKMPHSWGKEEKLLVQDYSYLYLIQNNFSSIIEVFSKLKMSESKLYFINSLADNFNVTDDQLNDLIDLYLKDHRNQSTSISSDRLMYLNIDQENYEVQGINLKKRNPEYLNLFHDYLEKNMLTTNSNAIDFKEFDGGIGVSSKVYARYYLLGKYGRAFQLNREFNEDSFEEYNSFVYDFNYRIKDKLAKLGITTSNMFIKNTNDGKDVQLGVLTTDKKISFTVKKDIKRFNSVLVNFTNQLLRDHNLDDRVILFNEQVYEIEHYAIMRPEKLEYLLKSFPQLTKI